MRPSLAEYCEHTNGELNLLSAQLCIRLHAIPASPWHSDTVFCNLVTVSVAKYVGESFYDWQGPSWSCRVERAGHVGEADG